MEDIADLASDAVGEVAEFAFEAGTAGLGFLPWSIQSWFWTAGGMALGAYLLLGDGAVAGTASDLWGAGLLIGSPVFLILVPRWWNSI